MPFTIDPNLPNPDRVNGPDGAISYYHNNTPIRFVTHTNEANFVIFKKGTDELCAAQVGMQAYSPQYIFLGDGCFQREIIHEMTHTVGLFHEQSRSNRDQFVRINYENIIPGKESQFNQYVTETGEDIGQYDYCSIMHYRAIIFSKNGQPTITVLQPTLPCASTIGQTSVLSEADKYSIRYMYVPTTVPDVVDFGVNGTVQRVKNADLKPKLVNADSVVERQSLLAGSWVEAQSPPAGWSVSRGTIVTLYWTNRPRP